MMRILTGREQRYRITLFSNVEARPARGKSSILLNSRLRLRKECEAASGEDDRIGRTDTASLNCRLRPTVADGQAAAFALL
jgi:hypothetical protein